LITSIAGTGLTYKIVTDNTNLTATTTRMEMNSSGEFGFGTTPVSGKVVTIGGDSLIDGGLDVNGLFNVSPTGFANTIDVNSIGNVGIGTTPIGSSKLSVTGQVRVTGDYISPSAAANSYFQGTLAVGTNASSGRRMRIDGGGLKVWVNADLEVNAQNKVLKGWIETTADPTTTEFPNESYGVHKNTTTGDLFFVATTGGTVRKVLLT
jgi:hypothetical protein